MSNIYDNGTYLEKNPTWHEEDAPWKAKQILRVIERNNLRPSSIGEIGCGSGEILRQLSLQLSGDIRFYGYETSKDAFNICKEKTGDKINFIHGNLLNTEAKYDLVLAIDVIEHVEDYYGFIRGLRSKGEYKIFHIPLDLSAQTVLRMSPLLNGRSYVGHIHYFTKETALAALEDVGYEVIDWFYTPGAIELPNRPLRMRMMKLPRKLLFKINQDFAVRLLGGYSLMVLAK